MDENDAKPTGGSEDSSLDQHVGTATGKSHREIPEDATIIVPMRSTVLFPGTIVPLTIGRPGSVAAVEEAVRSNRPIGFVLQHDAASEDPEPGELHTVGTTAGILRFVTGPDGAHHVVCQNQHRFRVAEFIPGFPFMLARVEIILDPSATGKEIEARALALRERAVEALQLTPQAPAELVGAVQATQEPSALADLVANFMDLKSEDKQEVLETVDIQRRLDKVLELLAHRVDVLRLSRQIDQQTQGALNERHREALLREQLRTIQSELGEADDKGDEIAEITKAIDKAEMPEEAEKQARKELQRLERMPEAAAEYSMVRSYLDWLVDLPWSVKGEHKIDLTEARQILDADHYGLEKIKRRIIEYLAVRKLSPNGKSPILCFVGPPGVGKTSLGRSIARAMGREFVRMSLGGMHDESEIRGHRRTYVGALPGSIIQSIRKAETRDCVFMLDEIDKLDIGARGDPSSALLEVLDPEQNGTFKDNYLGVPFDLSQVVFVATANVLDAIPAPLRDRMEVIELSGYTAEEKIQIAKRYVVERQIEANGLTSDNCCLTDGAIETIIKDYTREAGCRNLEREIGAVIRYAAVRIAEGSADSVEINKDDIAGILGAPRFESEVAMRTSLPGVATGLAWTPVGGDILFIETSRLPGSGRLILTGQLGDVMKESAQAALSLIKSKAQTFGLADVSFDEIDIHIHVPAGAIPKDGPSAGVAMFVALVSLLRDQTVANDVAMTGEISLRGLVLPVGGIKEKVLAASQAGITTVLLPSRNKRDFDDIPESARKGMAFVWLDNVDQALDAALTPPIIAAA
jgi:ATP-dependent Lon protease